MKRAMLLAALVNFGAGNALATVSPPAPVGVPLPSSRAAAISQRATVDAPSYETTGVVPRIAPISGIALDGALKNGLDALSAKDAAAALAIRERISDPLDRHILTWAIGVSGLPGIPSGTIAAAQRELKGWPGLSLFRANSEKAMLREGPPPQTVIAAFGKTRPETPQGTIVLARALVADGQAAAAAKLLARSWREDALDTELESAVLAEFPTLLTVDDHRARMIQLLYRGRLTQAKRFAPLGKAQSLHTAWNAVKTRSPKAAQLLEAVDAGLKKDPAYLNLRVDYLNGQQKYADAARLLAEAPRDPALLVNPGEWWNEQRIAARGLADQGAFKAAYQLAAGHLATEATDIVDAEFHAGWFALRGLSDTKAATTHFRRILDASQRPLSASRAWYWLGRTADQANSGEAAGYYAKAAAYPSTFYGQLAAAKLKQPALDIPYPAPNAGDRHNYAAREAVQAIGRLEAAGHGWRAASLYRALAQQIESPGELAILAAQAEKSGDHQLSLQIGKTAYGRGIDVAALAFPVGVIPDSANIAGAGKALAYAIARQESAFNPAAVSAADARGLLQLLPGTAKGVAGRHGLAYSKDRLTTDAGYNATLGAHYLGEQIDSFGGSYILTFIAYNAGPRRVPEWIARYGSPQGKPIEDVVDWIERIPFPETRNYVQRVMENYQIYKTRLGQKPSIEEDLRFGRT